MKHLKLLIFISTIFLNLEIICKDKREYGSIISLLIPSSRKNRSVSSDSSTQSDKSHLYNAYRVLGTRTRSINDYRSKSKSASLAYAKGNFSIYDQYAKHRTYQENIEYERLEKIYGTSRLRKYDITYKQNDKLQTFEEMIAPDSTLTPKPKYQLTWEANEEAKFIRSGIDYYELGLDDKSNTSPMRLDFAECGLFYEPESDITIKVWEWARPNWLTKHLFSDKKIFSMFANFYNYPSKEYIEDLRSFPCFDRFMQEFAKQIENNPEFRKSLEDMDNGQQVIDFIKNEAFGINEANQHNKQIVDQQNKVLIQKSIIARDLKNTQSQFEAELKQDPNNKINWQENITAIEKTIKDPIASHGNYTFSKNGISVLDYLKINKANLISFTGNHLQHHFHKKAVDTINTSAEVWVNSTNIEVKRFIEVAVTFAVKCTELNRVGCIFGAANCINAATDILTGAVLRCKEIPQNLANFKAHPFDTIANKCDEIAISAINIITSTTKACAFLLVNVPASHGIPTPTELKKLDNIDAKAQELQQLKDHINTYLENTPRTEKLQSFGYLATDVVFDSITTKAILSASGSALKSAISASGKTLKKLGPIGDDVAKLAGLMIDKGVKATETVLDAVRHQPELVTAEGGVFKFVENALEKEQKVVSGFKEIGKNVAKAEKIVKQFDFKDALKKIKEVITKPNGDIFGIPGSEIVYRELNGNAKDAKAFFDKLVNKIGVKHLVKDHPKIPGGKIVHLPGNNGSICFRPFSKSIYPTIDIHIEELKTVITKIKFTP